MAERAAKHFAALNGEFKKITVDEWKDNEGNPAEIYFKPMNLRQRQIVDQNSKDQVSAAIEIIVMKSCDENGEKLFSISDKVTLLKSSEPQIIAGISEKILQFKGDNEDLDEDTSKKYEEIKENL